MLKHENSSDNFILLGDMNVNLKCDTSQNILTKLEHQLSCKQIKNMPTTDFDTLKGHAQV